MDCGRGTLCARLDSEKRPGSGNLSSEHGQIMSESCGPASDAFVRSAIAGSRLTRAARCALKSGCASRSCVTVPRPSGDRSCRNWVCSECDYSDLHRCASSAQLGIHEALEVRHERTSNHPIFKLRCKSQIRPGLRYIRAFAGGLVSSGPSPTLPPLCWRGFSFSPPTNCVCYRTLDL
jgi:hypothetical protein